MSVTKTRSERRFIGIVISSILGGAVPTTRKKFIAEDAPFTLKQRKPVPHQFVLDALAELEPYTRPMFGCLAIYVGDKIVLILRDRPNHPEDNGVWLATTREHHESLRREFPSMRTIGLLGEDVTNWQVLPASAPDFEQAALHACELVITGDPRIGKVPNSRRAKPITAKTKSKKKSRKG